MLTHVENYRSANLVACNQFIIGLFPWKRTGLGRVGVKGKVSGQSRATKVRVAEDQGGEPLGSLRTGGQRPSSPGARRESKSFVLRTYIVGRIGEKKVTY